MTNWFPNRAYHMIDAVLFVIHRPVYGINTCFTYGLYLDKARYCWIKSAIAVHCLDKARGFIRTHLITLFNHKNTRKSNTYSHMCKAYFKLFS